MVLTVFGAYIYILKAPNTTLICATNPAFHASNTISMSCDLNVYSVFTLGDEDATQKYIDKWPGIFGHYLREGFSD